MVIKVYTSGISGNKEVKKRQQRIMMILESKNIKYVAVDITEPGKETEKQFMQDNAKASDAKHPLPPQIFNGQEYCGDYVGFDLANENDELEVFLKLPLPTTPAPPAEVAPASTPIFNEEIPPVINGREHSTEKDTSDPQVLERQNGFISSVASLETSNGGLSDEEEKEEVLELEEVMEMEEVVEIEEVVEMVEPSVHGFCYTPGLAKRIEKALKLRIRKPKPKSVHGYCYTPSLAKRLIDVITKSLRRKEPVSQIVQRNHVEDTEMQEKKQEIDLVRGYVQENNASSNSYMELLLTDTVVNQDNNMADDSINEDQETIANTAKEE